MKFGRFVVNLIAFNLDSHNKQRRKKFKVDDFKGMKDVPYIDDNKIGINTGCGIRVGAPLTAYICNENKFITS